MRLKGATTDHTLEAFNAFLCLTNKVSFINVLPEVTASPFSHPHLLSNSIESYCAAWQLPQRWSHPSSFTFIILPNFASEKRIPGKWRRQECDCDSIAMNNRSTIAMDRLACPRSASSRSRMLFSWRIKRSMWTLYQAFADRSTSQVYLWAITFELLVKL